MCATRLGISQGIAQSGPPSRRQAQVTSPQACTISAYMSISARQTGWLTRTAQYPLRVLPKFCAREWALGTAMMTKVTPKEHPPLSWCRIPWSRSWGRLLPDFWNGCCNEPSRGYRPTKLHHGPCGTEDWTAWGTKPTAMGEPVAMRAKYILDRGNYPWDEQPRQTAEPDRFFVYAISMTYSTPSSAWLNGTSRPWVKCDS